MNKLQNALMLGALGCGTLFASASAVGANPLSANEEKVARLMVRHDFLKAVSGACGRMFPAGAERYQQALQAWKTPKQPELDQAARLLLERSGPEHATEMAPLVEAEKKVLQAWQVDTLKISMQKAPQVGDCDLIAASLSTLP